MKPPNCLCTILLTFLFILFSCSDSSKAASLCSSSCGDIGNISYPFRLKGDPPRCGDPDYELSCRNNRTILELFSGKYLVKQISYQDREIRLVDVNFIDGACNLPYRSVSPDDVNSNILYRGRFVFYTYVSFIECPRIIVDPRYVTVPCLSSNTSSVYVIVGGNTFEYLPRGCNFRSMSLVSTENVNGATSYEAVRRALQMGFELGWSVECRNCILSKQCALTSLDRPLTYVCSQENTVGTILSIAWRLIVWLFTAFQLIVRFLIAPIIIIVILILKYRKEHKPEDDVEKFLCNQQSFVPKRYAYTDLIAITNHFRDKLGKGGFGTVYKGQLPGNFPIAVKILHNSNFSADEFINEVSTVGRIRHLNVVQLIGYCSEDSNRALVYEYMPNGSLDKHIFSGNRESIQWEKLLEMALGIARGIEYLHEGCDQRILHFDIKPQNILLDVNFVPKVSDFGLAKLYSKERDFASISTARGTIGYISPELISRNYGSISAKSDVYSFGMLLLEMARGKRNVDSIADGSSASNGYFPSWVYDHLRKGGNLEIQNGIHIESEIAKKLCVVGLWCIQMRPSDRPTMSRAIEMLEGSTDGLMFPPKPFIFTTGDLSSTIEKGSDSSSEGLTLISK